MILWFDTLINFKNFQNFCREILIYPLVQILKFWQCLADDRTRSDLHYIQISVQVDANIAKYRKISEAAENLINRKNE